jgi:hypothetical protein
MARVRMLPRVKKIAAAAFTAAQLANRAAFPLIPSSSAAGTNPATGNVAVLGQWTWTGAGVQSNGDEWLWRTTPTRCLAMSVRSQHR